MEALRRPPLSFDVVINQKELLPRDPNLIYYPLIYIHGRAGLVRRTPTSRRCGITLIREAGRFSPTRRAAARRSTLRFASSWLCFCPTTRSSRFRALTSSIATKVGYDL